MKENELMMLGINLKLKKSKKAGGNLPGRMDKVFEKEEVNNDKVSKVVENEPVQTETKEEPETDKTTTKKSGPKEKTKKAEKVKKTQDEYGAKK